MSDVPLAIARGIRLLTCDVDGVLTDGRIYVDDTGREQKAFNALDGVGLRLLMQAGVRVAWITGRPMGIGCTSTRVSTILLGGYLTIAQPL